MSFITERDGKGTIIISPKNEALQSGLVVLSHGLGDSAEGMVDVAEGLAEKLPHLRFILPTAPTQPVTMNMGMPMPSWYDITGIDSRSNEKCKGIDESQAKLAQILSREHKATHLPYSRMMLAGFSQGGALSLFTGMQLPEKLAGIVMMSSYLPAASQFTITDGLHDTPILHCHGTSDPMVLYHMAQKSEEIVVSEKGSTNYHLKAYPGLPHTISPGELEDVQEFIEECLPDDPTYRITPKQPSEMSVKELKAAIRRAGLSNKAKGFVEKSEFIELLVNYREGNLSGSCSSKSKEK